MTIRGILVVEGKVLKVQFTNANGKEVAFIIADAHTAPSILVRKKTQLAELAGMAVDLEVENGQPRQVRPQGESWQSNNTDRQQRNIQNDRSGNNRDRQTYQNNPNPQTQAVNPPVASVPGDFHNPYNFVPALPRAKVTNELGDRQPVGHDRYLPGHWSGSIRVKITTKTPLLIPDAFQVSEENDHKTFPLRTLDNKPYLPPTSIKGMLRAAYEAVTNSRLSIFSGHDDLLVYRMPAKVGIEMVPARIENGQIILYPGSSNIQYDGRPSGAMYAAWLPMYDRSSSQVANRAIKFPDGSLPQHRQKVNAWLEKYEKIGQSGVIFSYWRVCQIVPAEQSLENRQPSRGQDSQNHRSTGEYKQVTGFVCITNKNIDGKHDERVFFSDRHLEPIDISKDLRTKWQQLIENYQNIHKDEVKAGANSPPALNHSIWSRHVTGGSGELELSDGTLCYAHVYENDREQIEVINLYPVMIARSLFARSPADLLEDRLQPASNIKELSPADRVFGWINQAGNGAYRGNLRISDVQCTSKDPIQNLETGLPLAILGQPKPQQGRFYAAEDERGTPFAAGVPKHQFYQLGTGLRGRKVYPHHQSLPNNYWDTPLEDRTKIDNEGTFQEYRRPKKLLEQKSTQNRATSQRVTPKPVIKKISEQQDSQNRSINAWVKPDVTFECSIEITNLSSVELGALLWLLSLPPDSFHRLGGGKPLGFGSVAVSVDWDATDLRRGEDWRDFYSSLVTIPASDRFDSTTVIADFRSAVEEKEGYGKEFAEVSFIKAFCQAARGFSDGKPIHYPRTSVKPNPEGEAFKWFTENEVIPKDRFSPKRQHSLGVLIDDPGLPIFTARQG
jgi:CRISPR-associated protein (TIGR03986 family)